ncbi:MAG: hypothetical protein WC787_03820 [Patescibacteria group bacterium]|jgi:uncharacterized membrane protein
MTEPLHASVLPSFDKKDVEDNKFIAALSYLGILFLIPLLLKRESRFCKEHALQGLVLFVVWIIGSFVYWIPLIGWAMGIALLIINVIAIVKCVQGEFWEIPYLGPLRKKINL